MNTEAASTSPRNRTNVRPNPWALRAVRAGLAAVEAGSPELAARVVSRLMFRTTRRAPAPREEAIRERGTSFRIPSIHGPLAAWRWGEGPVVLLVHGWNGRGVQLGALVDPLVQRGFQVVAFDAPGHGRSPGASASLVHFADGIDAALDAVRPTFGPIHAVVAHSMGGAATTFAMSRFQRAPTTQLERGLREAALPSRRFVFVAPPVDVGDFVRSAASYLEVGAATQAAVRRQIEERFALRIEEMYAPAAAQALGAPLLVLHDEDDQDVPLACGRLLAEAWPGARLEVTHGLGHHRILRDPGVAQRIAAFVAEEPEAV